MKKKTFVFILLLLAVVGWFVLRAITHSEVKVVVKTSDPQSAVKTDHQVPASLKTDDQSPTSNNLEEKKNYREKVTKDEEFEAFDKMENAWLLKVRDLIGPEKYSLYLSLREQNEKEKMQAYKEYHEFLRKKYGDNFSYKITDDQTIREKEINQRYLDELLKLIGKEKFQAYTNSKDQFNEQMRRDNKAAIQIEF